ncbi:hypothetical protein BST61_g8316 [Cercospora zeina]
MVGKRLGGRNDDEISKGRTGEGMGKTVQSSCNFATSIQSDIRDRFTLVTEDDLYALTVYKNESETKRKVEN